MDKKLATELVKANLDCLARSFGFNESDVGDAAQSVNGTWHVIGEIYKGQYSVCVREISSGVMSILITDLSMMP